LGYVTEYIKKERPKWRSFVILLNGTYPYVFLHLFCRYKENTHQKDEDTSYNCTYTNAYYCTVIAYDKTHRTGNYVELINNEVNQTLGLYLSFAG